MRRILLIAMTLSAAPMVAVAQPVEPNCADPQTQAEMTACAGMDYEAADAELNALWPDLIAKAQSRDADMGDFFTDRGLSTTEETLRRAQRAWIAYRDAECEYRSYDALGGTMQPMIGSQCRADLTRARIKTLRSVLDRTEGDLGARE